MLLGRKPSHSFARPQLRRAFRAILKAIRHAPQMLRSRLSKCSASQVFFSLRRFRFIAFFRSSVRFFGTVVEFVETRCFLLAFSGSPKLVFWFVRVFLRQAFCMSKFLVIAKRKVVCKIQSTLRAGSTTASKSCVRKMRLTKRALDLWVRCGFWSISSVPNIFLPVE